MTIDALRALKSYYQNKNIEYESIKLQALINHCYLKLGMFTGKERWALRFSKWSSDFGTNYFKAVGFTLGVTAIYYLMILWTLKWEGKIDYCWSWEAAFSWLSYYTKTLNVANWKFDYFEQPSSRANSLLYFGRIFTGFGIYQIIAAFRRVTKM